MINEETHKHTQSKNSYLGIVLCTKKQQQQSEFDDKTRNGNSNHSVDTVISITNCVHSHIMWNIEVCKCYSNRQTSIFLNNRTAEVRKQIWKRILMNTFKDKPKKSYLEEKYTVCDSGPVIESLTVWREHTHIFCRWV